MNELNPFGGLSGHGGTLATAEAERAIQEVQAAVLIAKRFPRNELAQKDKILKACDRKTLAEVSHYEYERGGETIRDGTIHLAKACAALWQNIDYGWREIDRQGDVSTVLAYAWDIENNVRHPLTFQVKHVRHRRPERGGPIPLTDPRDIYENMANQAARRLRACIFAVLPGDVIEEAKRQCDLTLAAEPCDKDQIKAVVAKFAELEVTPEMLAKRLEHPLAEMTSAELISLRRVFLAIKEGYGTVDEMFEGAKQEKEDEEAADLRARVAEKRKQQEEERRKAAAEQADAQKRAQAEAQKRQAQEQAKKEAAVEKQIAAQEAKASESPQTTEKAPTPTEVSPQPEQKQDEQGQAEQGSVYGAAKVVNAKDVGAPEPLWEFVVEKQGSSGWPKRLSDGKWYDARWYGIEADSEEAAESLGVGWAKAGHPSVAHQTGNFAKKRSRKAKVEPPAPKEKPDYTDGDDAFGNY